MNGIDDRHIARDRRPAFVADNLAILDVVEHVRIVLEWLMKSP